MTLSEEGRKAVAAAEAARLARWYGDAPLVQPVGPGHSRYIGDIALLEPGCVCWSHARRYADQDETPVGGVIIEITARPDPDTGEAVRQYRTIDPNRLRPPTFHTLDMGEVDRGTLEVSYTARTVACIQALCAEVAAMKGRLLMPDKARHVRDAYLLTATLMARPLAQAG